MRSAFLIPGYNKTRIFNGTEFDNLRNNMTNHGITLYGVQNAWGDHGVNEYGLLAAEQIKNIPYEGLIIAHSLGAIAALKVIERIEVRHLVLCSTSSLFAEDILESGAHDIVKVVGRSIVDELSDFSANQATEMVNRLGIKTTVVFGEKEHASNPMLVKRNQQLASSINDAELITIPSATHKMRENPYATEISRIVATKILLRGY